MDVLHLGVVIRDFLDDLLHSVPHDVVVVVHHHDLALRDQLDALDLVVIDQKPFVVHLFQYDHGASSSHTPRPGDPGRGSPHFISA